MLRLATVLIFAWPKLATALSSSQSNAALQKVIELLANMEQGAKKEKHEEEVTFARYETWCRNEVADLEEQLERHDAEGKKQLSLKESKAAQKATLEAEILALQGDVAGWTGERDAAQAQRNEEKGIFDTENLDYGESINALGRAILTLQTNASGSVAQKGEALLQVQAILAGRKGMLEGERKLAMFLQQGQPKGEAAAYEFGSQNVIDLLAELKVGSGRKT